jgi:hypothetical protein
MKSIIFSLMAIVISLTGWGQENYFARSAEERARIQTNWMNTKFQLDSFTANKVFLVNLKYAQKADSLNSTSGSVQTNQLLQLQREKDSDLKMVFSIEQYKKYTEWKKKIKDNSKNLKIKPNSKSNQL